MTVREASDKVERGFSRVEKGFSKVGKRSSKMGKASARMGKASGKVGKALSSLEKGSSKMGKASGKELFGTRGKHGAVRARWGLPSPGKPALLRGKLDTSATCSRREGKAGWFHSLRGESNPAVCSSKRMTTKHLGLIGWLLQIAFWVFLILGLDSEKQPTTIPFMVAAMVCAIAGLVVLVFQYRRAAQERNRTDE